MMRLIYLFFVYSFIGWLLETTAVAFKWKKIVNRGFLNGPLCMIYGSGAVLLTVTLPGLWNNLFFLFFFSMVYATVMELLAGKLLEARYHGRWWDYSDKKFNFDGYICLSHSLLWGVLGVVVIRWMNHILLKLYQMCPPVVRTPVLWGLVGLTIVDLLGTDAVLKGDKKKVAKYSQSNRMIAQITAAMRKRIYDGIENRITKAHPVYEEKNHAPGTGSGVFAQGCGFYKVFWLFLSGALIGDLVETVFCRIRLGWWMSRSSVVWGPFSLIWGIGIALFTMILYQHRNRSYGFLFAAGTVLGGSFEYLCSVFTERVFGTIFWDYSKVPFNLMGRVSLIYCFFWGIAAVVWFKVIYGWISGLIEKIPMRPGKILTWILVVFMAADIAVSALALSRYQERQIGVEPKYAWQEVIDSHFDDARMKKIYPKAKGVQDRGKPVPRPS